LVWWEMWSVLFLFVGTFAIIEVILISVTHTYVYWTKSYAHCSAFYYCF
jgi:hypothetical protein